MPTQKDSGSLQNIDPISLLIRSATDYNRVQLRVYFKQVYWSFCLEQGQLIYASNSIVPMERLDRHLNRLKHRLTLNQGIDGQLQNSFEIDLDTQAPDYQAICHFVNRQLLNPAHAAILLETMAQEVIESFLWLNQGTYEIKENLDPMTEVCRFSLKPLVEYCHSRLQDWQALGPHICSPYQRPFICHRTNSKQHSLLPIEPKISSFLKGKLSFYHLAILMRQSELQIAQNLHPYILDGTILLHEPYSPFDQLPKIPVRESLGLSRHLGITTATAKAAERVGKNLALTANKNKYNIVCIDDSEIALRDISQLLDSDFFTFFPITDSLKALFQILRVAPDLILLKTTMSKVNGYHLCQLIKNHRRIKNTPVIMISESRGIIDWAKAKLLGASGYLHKPIEPEELLKVIFKNLP